MRTIYYTIGAAYFAAALVLFTNQALYSDVGSESQCLIAWAFLIVGVALALIGSTRSDA